MAVGPLLPGRIPNQLSTRRVLEGLADAAQTLQRLQEQLTSGHVFSRPGEAPAPALRTMGLQRALERNEQLRANITTDRTLLSVSEGALATISDILNRARAFVAAGIGDSSTTDEKLAMATEVATMVQQVVRVGNTEFQGRYLFAGTDTRTVPFDLLGNGVVRYNGDVGETASPIDVGLLVANNIDGDSAFGAMTPAEGRDVDPALTLATRLEDLHGGAGIEGGSLIVTLDDGANQQKLTIDLSTAETIGDVKTILEDAFAGGPLTLTVQINDNRNGLKLTPSVGATVAVSDLEGSRLAADLGIASAAAPVIDGADLDPRLTLQTALADLNGGTGIGPTAGKGLLITSGDTSQVVDISTATTVEDLFNILELADLDLAVSINEAGNGLSIRSRLSGVPFSIGENGGTNATLLGVRTLVAESLLEDLNFGQGVPVEEGSTLELTLRDGTQVSIDLEDALTVQDVLDRINAVANVTAALTPVGNGIDVTDATVLGLNTRLETIFAGAGVSLGQIQVTLDDGAAPQTATVDLAGAETINDVKTRIEAAFAGPLSVVVDIDPGTGGLRLTAQPPGTTVEVSDLEGATTAAELGIDGPAAASLVGTPLDPAFVVKANDPAIALGIDGSAAGAAPTATINGRDVHMREANGVLNILSALESALRDGDDAELTRLGELLDEELVRFNAVRGELGDRLQLLDRVENRLLDQEVSLRSSLSEEFDIDLAEVITQLVQRQQALEAALRVASTTVRMSLVSFL